LTLGTAKLTWLLGTAMKDGQGGKEQMDQPAPVLSHSGAGWRVLLGAVTGAVVGGYLGATIADALSCHPYVNFCEFGALNGLGLGVVGGFVVGAVVEVLIHKAPAMVIVSFMLLGTFLGAAVAIWINSRMGWEAGIRVHIDRYVGGFVGLCIGAAVSWLYWWKRRQDLPPS
jgi:hypothetical protein